MSYPQVPADAAAKNAFYNAYRLSTLLASPGDIYELNVGAKAIVVGPDSDIANIQVTYYDDLVPGSFTNLAVVSPDRSFVNQLAARLDQPYPSTGKKGRVLISPADLFYPTIGTIGNDVLSVIKPRLDVMAYFDDLPSVIPQRSDGLWFLNEFAAVKNAGGTSYIVVPYWGRKYASISFLNAIGIGIAVDYVLEGINYYTSGFYKVAIDSAAGVANGASHQSIVRASVNGMFDALRIGFKPASGTTVGPMNCKVITSDDPL